MQVFISHSDSDSLLAARVSRALQKTGLKVWNQGFDLLPGDNRAAEVGRALEMSEAMVVLLTPNSVGSSHVRREIEYALGSKNYSNRLIPVLVGGREQVPMGKVPWMVLSWTLSLMQQVDFTRSFHDGCRELLRMWEVEYVPAGLP